MHLHSLAAYLPEDRYRALADGKTLPDRSRGSCLFADISGFTSLTESLTYTLGPRRGVEELIRQINEVYDALIAVVELYGGSVISFAGDAIICWFDGDGAREAVTAALELQKAMDGFPALEIKVAVTTGPARRFVVGNPSVQRLDVLSGETIARLEILEQMTCPGSVIVDAITAAVLEEALVMASWCVAESGERFAVVQELTSAASQIVPQPLPALEAESLRPWILPAVWEREQNGHGLFLTELRPAVAFFLNFSGLDYDADDEAPAKLNEFVVQVQALLNRYEGVLLQVNMGDKGSYLYGLFGAPTAHEDDAWRAVQAAWELQWLAMGQLWLTGVQIGITQGVLRTGAYGGTRRHIYGALGDEVNLAARLMQAAGSGQVLLSNPVYQAVKAAFSCESLPLFQVKGKNDWIEVWQLVSPVPHNSIRRHEPVYALPMVGRERELLLVSEKLNLALEGRGQMVGIVAEAGMGKSRLVSKIVGMAAARGMPVYYGAAQSFGTHNPYLVWRDIWREFFGLDPTQPILDQIEAVEQTLAGIDPLFVQRAPLLDIVLDLAIPENDLTQNLDARQRNESLTALLVDCFKAFASRSPLVLILEDLHWMDALSYDLLKAIGRNLAGWPVLFVMAYRPPEVDQLPSSYSACFTEIVLSELTAEECRQLIESKAGHYYPEINRSLPSRLVERMLDQAQGNPFYLEELFNYLRDHDLNPYNPKTVDQLELPDSLHMLILSRIDQLSEREKAVLKAASIIGRVFKVSWLQGYYPALGELSEIAADLDHLERLDITPLDSREPELVYMFKHIITQQVAYESLPYATRAQLHEQLAQYLEATCFDALPLDMLAYHYGLSDNLPKTVEYLQRAAQAAQAAFANDAALDYYERLLPLLTRPEERIELQLTWGAVLELIGQWDRAETHYWDALTIAQAQEVTAATIRSRLALGKLLCQRADYAVALKWLEGAKAEVESSGDQSSLGPIEIEMGFVYLRQGDMDLAEQYLKDGFVLARQVGDRFAIARALNLLGNLSFYRGEYDAAGSFYAESLALKRELGDWGGICRTLCNLGMVAFYKNDYVASRAIHEEGLALSRKMGDKSLISALLSNFGDTVCMLGDYGTAQEVLEEGLGLVREIRDRWNETAILNSLGEVAFCQNLDGEAQTYFEEGLALAREIGDGSSIAFSHLCLGLVALVRRQGDEAGRLISEALRLHREIGHRAGTICDLIGMAGLAMDRDDPLRAAKLTGAAYALLGENPHMESIVRSIYDDTVAAARAALGPAAFDAARAEGAKLSIEEAVDCALEK